MKKPIKGLDWLEQALRRIAADRAENLARFAAFDARVEETLKRAQERRTLQAEARIALRDALEAQRRARGLGPKPPRKRRPDEGGEPIPAVPRPKPKPLSGGAAAPLKFKVRATRTASQPKRVKTSPTKVPSEADRDHSL